jgi:hypothetical protein
MKKSGIYKFFDNYKRAIVVVAICAILGLVFYNLANSKGSKVDDDEELYKKAEQYITSRVTPMSWTAKDITPEESKNLVDFKVFSNVRPLGIYKKGDYYNVYVWATVQSFFVNEFKLNTSSSFSNAFMVTFENGVAIESTEAITDSDTRELLPGELYDKAKEQGFFGTDDKTFENQIQAHYSYLHDDDQNEVVNHILSLRNETASTTSNETTDTTNESSNEAENKTENTVENQAENTVNTAE